MTKNRVTGIVACLLALLLVAPAVQADDWVAKWSNGHKIENSDKGHKMKFGGRLMADYTFADVDASLDPGQEDGFEFRRARIFFSGTVYGNVEFKANYDFSSDGPEFKDVWIALKQDWGKVKFGHFKEYHSLEEATSSKYIPFLERSLPNAFSPSRNSGIGFEGKQGDKFNWGVGYFYDSDDFGESRSEDATAINGRVGFRPQWEDGGAQMVHIAADFQLRDTETVRYRTRPEAHFATRYVDTGTFIADGVDIFTVELATVQGPFWAASEYVTADVDAPLSGDPSFDSYYVQLGYFLTGEHKAFKTSSGAWNRQKPAENWDGEGGSGAWEIVGRYSTIDLNDGAIQGGEQDNVSLALNWYLNPATRLMLNYVHADVDSSGEGDFVLARWSFDF
ncbi:MAG: porin [Acidobacteriota bacterium]